LHARERLASANGLSSMSVPEAEALANSVALHERRFRETNSIPERRAE
jgi:hypothetical protein